MSRRKSVHKFNIGDVEETIALAHVTKDEETEKALYLFCSLFGVELDNDVITNKTVQYGQVAKAIEQAEKRSKSK